MTIDNQDPRGTTGSGADDESVEHPAGDVELAATGGRGKRAMVLAGLSMGVANTIMFVAGGGHSITSIVNVTT